MNPNLRFGLVLDRPAGLEISAFFLKYPSFEGGFFCILMDKTSIKLEFLHIVVIGFH